MNLRRLRYSMSAAAAMCLVLLACGTQNQESAGDQAALTSQSPPTSETPPPWAFIIGPRAERPEDDGTKLSLPGSSATFTRTELRNGFNVADWYPDDHPPMPDFVAHGREPDIRGCGYCHQPNGLGRPENAPLAGLPADYIVGQMAAFRNDLRESSGGRSRSMIAIAKVATDAEVREAAEYFSSLEYKPWIRVVETDTVPKTHVEGMFVPIEPADTEPLGQRIIEVPEDVQRTEIRDPRSGFIAYVPIGSIQKGEELVRTGGDKVVEGQIVEGKTIQCGICHGPDLKGLGNVPGIAGRSPSYITRQLYDMQHGNRKGPGTELMKAVVANLSEEDMVSIAAYTASRVP